MSMSINKIPADLWCRIVEFCEWEVSWRLSLVNKHFRNIMLSTPEPWRRVLLDLRDLLDYEGQEMFDQFVIVLGRRSENSMKHVELVADSESIESQCELDWLLGRFNAIDHFILDIRTNEYSERFGVHCPNAKHVRASVSVEPYDDDIESNLKGHPPSRPNLFRLCLNAKVESVECTDMLLQRYSLSRQKRSTSLKSVTIDLTDSYMSYKIRMRNYQRDEGLLELDDDDSVDDENISIMFDYDDDDDDNDDGFVFDDDQFRVLADSPQLESLSVAYTDAKKLFRGVTLPSLKSLSVKKSACNFLRKSHLPVLESLTLTECRVLDAEMCEVFSNCMIKHLNLIATITPFSFNQACIVSLSLQSSSTELRRLMNSSGFANFTSLKALNVSFTHLSLEEVLFIVGQVDNLEQLVSDLPEARERGDCADLESAIAEIVPYYWMTEDQYFEDIQANKLKQYFFPHYRAKQDYYDRSFL